MAAKEAVKAKAAQARERAMEQLAAKGAKAVMPSAPMPASWQVLITLVHLFPLLQHKHLPYRSALISSMHVTCHPICMELKLRTHILPVTSLTSHNQLSFGAHMNVIAAQEVA